MAIRAMRETILNSFIIKILSKSDALKEVVSCTTIRLISATSRAHLEILGLIPVAFIAVAINGCAIGASMSHLDHLLREQGDRITYLSTGRFFALKFVTVRSTQRGGLQIDPKKTVDLEISFDRETVSLGSVHYTVLAQSHLLENLREFHEPLAHQLNHSLELIRAREIPKLGYSMDILIRLVESGSAFDYQKTHFYFDQPTLEFVASVDVRSKDQFEYSLITVLDTIHHELIHFAANLAWIEIPGESLDERLINEEAFATIVGRCDALTLFSNFYGDRPRLRFVRQRQEKIFDPAELRVSSDREDLKLLGRVIGLETFLEEVPRDRYLDAGQLERMLERCDALSRRAPDISRRYFEHSGRRGEYR